MVMHAEIYGTELKYLIYGLIYYTIYTYYVILFQYIAVINASAPAQHRVKHQSKYPAA